VGRVFDEIFNCNNLAAVDQLIAVDYVYRRPGAEELCGRPTYKLLIARVRTAFPTFHFTVDQMIAEGEHVCSRWTFTGTHQGEFMGVPATGKRVTAHGMLASRCVAGQIVDEWEIMDELGILRQMGAIDIHAPSSVPTHTT
jgi:steroid delta-isomerase-like uncharacterized protein